MANAATVVTVAPTATDNAARGSHSRLTVAALVSAGSVRSTSTNTTSRTVSTRNCVSARSGAPCSANTTPVP